MLSRFDIVLEREGQTDRRTELLYQYRASSLSTAMLTRDKKTLGRLNTNTYTLHTRRLLIMRAACTFTRVYALCIFY